VNSTTSPGALVLGSDFKALGVVRSLGRRGIACAVVDDLPRSAWFSRYVSRRFRWSGAMWGPAFVDFLLRLGQQGFADWVLMPMQDEVVELVARDHQALSGVYRLVTQEWETIRWAHDKRLAYAVAEEVGVPVPRTWYPADAGDLERMDIRYPAIIKPAISIGLQYAIGRKLIPVRTREELLEGYAVVEGIISPTTVMVQETIPGDGRSQYSVAAFCKDGGVVAAMTARRTRQYPADYGVSSTFVEAVPVPGLLEPAQRLIRRLRLSGMVELEFKHDGRDGENKLLDINVRPWGWHTLCIACGLDFPYMQYRDGVGQPLDAVSVHYGPRWRRLITDVPAALQEIRARVLTPAGYVRSLPGRTVPSVLDPHDPLPAVGDLAVALWRSLKTGSRGRARIASVTVSASAGDGRQVIADSDPEVGGRAVVG
jgi:predicted ATP-grasp superfamily ATP-dependent carboligase